MINRASPIRSAFSLFLLIIVLPDSRADTRCTAPDEQISSDRPSIGNTAFALQRGSLQIENGLSVTHDHGASSYDLPETHLRTGLSECNELFIDLLDYTHTDQIGGPSGASSISPGLKHQFSEWITGLTVAGTLGVYLSTGNPAISGAGPNVFMQIPAEYDAGNGWTVSGMFSALGQRHEDNKNSIYQTSASIDKSVTDRIDLYVEYATTYQKNQTNIDQIDIGGTYLLTPHQQLDFKIGTLLHADSANYYCSFGYSIRFDNLF